MDSLDKQQIAGLVKAGRTAKGYTQQELADRTGITLRSVQRIECGEVLPRAYTLRLLEEQLGIALTPTMTTIPIRGETASALLEGERPAEYIPRIPATAPGGPGRSRGRKWILTISLGLLLPLLTMAFLAQSARWPETDFERILLWCGVLAAYTLILWKVWR